MVELVFLVDSDDKTLLDYPTNRLVGKPSGDPTGPLNDAAIICQEEAVGFIGDDSRFETQGWDLQVGHALPGMIWTEDGHEKPWPSTIFMDTAIVKALGWMALPGLRRGYFDTVWVDLALAAGLAKEIPSVMIRHNNVGQTVDPAIIAADARRYEEWCRTDRAADIKKVKAAYALARFF